MYYDTKNLVCYFIFDFDITRLYSEFVWEKVAKGGDRKTMINKCPFKGFYGWLRQNDFIKLMIHKVRPT